MSEMGNLCFVLSGQISDSYLLFVAFLKLNLNCSFLIIENFFESIHLCLKGFSKVFNLLIFHLSISISLAFYFFEFSLMYPFIFFNLDILLMDFFSKFVLPGDFRIQRPFLQIIIILPCFLRFIFASSLKLFMVFQKGLMLNFKLVHFELNLPFVFGKVQDFLLQFDNLSIELHYMSFEDFLFRLNKFGLLFFVLDIPLNFLTKLDLNYPYSFIILSFHLCDDLLIHLDHLGEGLLDSVSLPLQEFHLIVEDLVGDLQLTALAGLLLDLLEVGCLAVEHMLGKLARSEGEVQEGSLSVFLRRQFIHFLVLLLLLPPTEDQLLHYQQKLFQIQRQLIVRPLQIQNGQDFNRIGFISN